MAPRTYLSHSGDRWRVIHQGGPICRDTDYLTALDVFGQAGGDPASPIWYGDEGVWLARPLVCESCGELVEPGAPRLGGWSLDLPPVRLAWRHLDGEPLCPVMGPGGYWPATPRVHPDRMAD